MNAIDTSDALDLTKENIRPLKHGRKPIQLETALQAQSSTEIQQKLNKEKEQYEHAIRTYEGNDPLAPRYEYIKWLEQIYLKHGPESNMWPLIEETVQKFKDDTKYKQDPRFVQILITFIENQSNSVELYQTVYNQGLGTMCASFYRAWADLLDCYNDFKRVDQIYLLGIQARAEPVGELEQAHIQFQLSVARRMLNGELSKDDKKTELEGRHAFGVLKKSETYSGVRHGLGGLGGKVPQANNINSKVPALQVFEGIDENGLPRIDNNCCKELVPKGLNKENTVKPGQWTKSKKHCSRVPKTVSTINFEVHQDNNVECVTKLPRITVPNALRSIKGSTTISCPIAVFEPPDPTKRPMYCKDKVYAAGRDVQIEEIRYEIYLKQEKEKYSAKEIIIDLQCPPEENVLKTTKKVILTKDNLNTNDFKIPIPLHMQPDPLSQSVTVNTRVALDLVQQMWNSPCTDKVVESDLISKDRKPILFNGFRDNDNNDNIQCPTDFMVYEDNKTPIKNNDYDKTKEMVKSSDKAVETELISKDRKPILSNVFSEDNNDNIQCPIDFMVYEDNKTPIKNNDYDKTKEMVKSSGDFCVYTDDDDQAEMYKAPKVCVVNNYEHKAENFKVPYVYIDENQVESINLPKVYIDKNDVKRGKHIKPNDNSINPLVENKSFFKKVQNTDVNDDDMTCSTKAFAFLLSSSTPVATGKTKSISVIGNQLPLELTEEKNLEEFPIGKNLSMILEASKEHNSISTTFSVTNQEQQSTIDFGDSINPFDDELISKLLQKKVKFPNERHTDGYVVHECDIPRMLSEFKLGHNKMSFISEIGKGSYARVVKAKSHDKNAMDKALKIQKPACAWEWYISKEIHHRLKDPEKVSYFINMDTLHIFKNGSIISMEYATYGTLLTVVSAYKKKFNQSIPVNVAALFALQVTLAVKYLHQCQMIHGDLKPDNVIVKLLPNQLCQPCVQLIDFGRSIDMTLLPPETTFTYSVKTADFVCHEMREKLPWTFQPDYFGLAGIIYMSLMSDYMKTQKIRKVWVLTKPFPRYIDKNLWDSILTMLLNVKSCKNLPNLDEIIDKIEKYLSTQQKVVLNHNFASLKNALKNI